MNLVFVDLETWWSQTHTLSKMSPIEYCMHPNTEIISCSIKYNDAPTDVFFGEDENRRVFAKLDWSNNYVIGHNLSGFDSMLLAWRLGVRPKMWGCTLAMARPIHAKTTGLGLAKLVDHYGIGTKRDAILHSTRGKHLADFTPDELQQMEAYNKADTEQCAALFHILKKHYNAEELWHLDCNIRMLVEPQFELDTRLLQTALSVERSNKHKALLEVAAMLRPKWEPAAVDVTDGPEYTDEFWDQDDGAKAEWVREQLASAPKFSALLKARGVEVPMKPSPTNPENQVPALAKTDEAFQELQEHEDEVVAAAARARLAVKSTLLETRIEALLAAASVAGGRLPVPLKYCGADTTGRDSGEQYNCFTGDHEVLTPSGWCRIDAWRGGAIMQWWPGGRLSWCAAPALVEYQHDGPIVEVSGPLARGRFTPDHRIVAVRDGRTIERTAGWVADHSGLDGVPACGAYDGGGSSLTPDQVRFLVAVAADGHITKGRRLQFGFARERKVVRLRRLVEALGLDHRVYDYRDRGGAFVLTVRKGALPDWVQKGFGPWVLDLTRASLDALVDELHQWDGSLHARSGQTCFYSADIDQAQWVATALSLSGSPARVSVRSKNRVDVYQRSTPFTSITGERSAFSGRVFCPKVESSYVLVRFDGAIHVTGNCQNLPRINPDKPQVSDALRNSLRAPKGYVVGVADQSGIELRVNLTLWKVPYAVDMLRADPKADLYKPLASEVLGVPVEGMPKMVRQAGKAMHLGCGFGLRSTSKYRLVARTMAQIEVSEEEADTHILGYRAKHPEVVDGWQTCHRALTHIYNGDEVQIDPWGLCHTSRHGIHLPSGRVIRYPELRQERGERGYQDWWYGAGRHAARIYAGKVDENIVQALARDSVFECALRFYKASRMRPIMRVHDELIYMFPESEAASLLAELQGIMRMPPSWWPELVVWSEGDIAPTYGAAK